MVINEFECPADMDALNTELNHRQLTADHIVAIMYLKEPSGSGMGSIETRYRVLYWDPAENAN